MKLLTILGKCYIHKSRVMESVPNFRLLCNDLDFFYDSLLQIQHNKKAKKTSLLLHEIIKAPQGVAWMIFMYDLRTSHLFIYIFI